MTTDAVLSDAEFEKIREYIYKRIGIHFTTQKRYFLDKRIETGIRNSGCGNFAGWRACPPLPRAARHAA